MKKTAYLLCSLLAAALACGGLNPVPGDNGAQVSTVVAATMQVLTPGGQIPSEAPPAFTGTTVEFGNLSLVIPPGVAAGASGVEVPPATETEAAPWDITPGHIELTFSGYRRQDHFHEPRIYVYPAAEYAALLPGAASNILALQDILANPAQLMGANNLPTIAFFNAGAVFASRDNLIEFRNGAGVRMLTQYAQSFAQINNYELFYHFQGLTSDGSYYLIAILPISAPILAPDHESPAPAQGVPFPGYTDPDVDYQAYYEQVVEKLNTVPGDSFDPTLTALDQLIGSIKISP